MPSSRSHAHRFAILDVLKAVSSQLIVLHHLAFYGPMSDFAEPIFPAFFAWLSQYGRIAVSVFLVMAGFLFARSFVPQGILRPEFCFFKTIFRRYLRLSLPLFFAVLWSILAIFVAKKGMDHEVIPLPPELFQVLSHFFLLQDIVGFDALFAGVWYVAIDYQLFVMTIAIFFFSKRIFSSDMMRKKMAFLFVFLVFFSSLFYFNRNSFFDPLGIYFFAAYALGILSFFVKEMPYKKMRLIMRCVIALSVIISLVIAMRSRIISAALCALFLSFSFTHKIVFPSFLTRLFSFLSHISYAVFLTHFSTILIVAAFFHRFISHAPHWQMLGLFVAWAASLWVGYFFHIFLEKPFEKKPSPLLLPKTKPLV